LNGRAIHTNDANVAIRAFDDNICALEIKQFTKEWCGTYTAVATNVYGDAHSSADVNLAAKKSAKGGDNFEFSMWQFKRL
jgi:hypothetical protein